MRKSQIFALLIITGLLTLTACGQKGPLYLSADEAASMEDKDAKKAADKEKSAGAVAE
jgi:predicted small lipoprotein YifL